MSLGALVQQISDLVDPENKHDITYVGACDAIETYITPLRHVLLNLISNSVKHHDGPKGTITVDAYLSNNRVHITVKDDGPGIAIGYHERVFGLFETLKPRDEVEGSGLGLSIIRKLLDHYKGSIRIVSNPQDRRGTSFLFDFPQTSSPKPLMRQAA